MLNMEIYFNGLKVSNRDLTMDCAIYVSHQDQQGREVWGEEIPQSVDLLTEMESAYEIVHSEHYAEELLVESANELKSMMALTKRLLDGVEAELELIRSGKKKPPSIEGLYDHDEYEEEDDDHL